MEEQELRSLLMVLVFFVLVCWIVLLCSVYNTTTVLSHPSWDSSRIRTRLVDFLALRLVPINVENGGTPIRVCALHDSMQDAGLCLNKDVRSLLVRKRAIFLTQTDTGDLQEYFIFGMYVYEFDEMCGMPPNKERAYITHLESTGMYQKHHGRHNLHFDIVNSYLEFLGSLGFHSAYLWSCPHENSGLLYRDSAHIFQGVFNAQRTQDELDTWYQQLLQHGGWESSKVAMPEPGSEEYLMFPQEIRNNSQSGKYAQLKGSLFVVDLTGKWTEDRYEVKKDTKTFAGSREYIHDSFDFTTMPRAKESTAKIIAATKKRGISINVGSQQSAQYNTMA